MGSCPFIGDAGFSTSFISSQIQWLTSLILAGAYVASPYTALAPTKNCHFWMGTSYAQATFSPAKGRMDAFSGGRQLSA